MNGVLPAPVTLPRSRSRRRGGAGQGRGEERPPADLRKCALLGFAVYSLVDSPSSPEHDVERKYTKQKRNCEWCEKSLQKPLDNCPMFG
jgi:hypothetical protein